MGVVITWKRTSRHHHGGGTRSLIYPSKSFVRAKEEEWDHESYSTVSVTSFSSSFSESEEFSEDILSSASDEMRQLILVDLVKENNVQDVFRAMQRIADMVNPNHFKGQKNQQYAGDTNALSNIVIAMKIWYNQEAIQTVGCCCVYYLACDKNNRTVLAKAAGLETVVQAMEAFPHSNGIQFAGCGAISKLLVGPDQRVLMATGAAKVRAYQPLAVKQATRQFVQDLDGVAVMICAMTKFPEYGGLQSLCCETLDLLASEEDFLDVLVTDHVAAAVSAANEQHGSDETCTVNQHAARFMLKKYVCMNEAVRQKCCISG